MKNTKVHSLSILALASFALITGCSVMTADNTAIPDEGSASADAYRSRCGSCHALPHPQRLSYADWQMLLPIMEQRIQERGMAEISTKERDTLLTYLKAHSR